MKNRLKEARQAKGYSQKYLAELLKIPANTYSQYENSVIDPKIEILIEASKLLEVSIDYLLYNNQKIASFSKSEKETIKYSIALLINKIYK